MPDCTSVLAESRQITGNAAVCPKESPVNARFTEYYFGRRIRKPGERMFVFVPPL